MERATEAVAGGGWPYKRLVDNRNTFYADATVFSQEGEHHHYRNTLAHALRQRSPVATASRLPERTGAGNTT